MLFRFVSKFFFMVLLFLIGANSYAQDRIALVIGNADYAHSALNNPLNDARDIKELLESFDFEVKLLENADKKSMERAVYEYSREIGKGTVGLFYYAGHGMQINGENYLIPVDAAINDESDVQHESMEFSLLLEGISRAGGGLNMVILDACRDNPYKGSTRSLARGFTRSAPSSGTMIMYATEPGRVAADGRGRNGIFTGELIQAVEEAPQSNIVELFRSTMKRVQVKTGGRQVPWSEGNTLEDFSFVLQTGEPESIVGSQSSQPLSATEFEFSIWKSALENNTIPYYEAYVKQFPDGYASEMARLKIGDLENKQRLTRELAESERRQQAEAEEHALVEAKQRDIGQLIKRVTQSLSALRLTSPESNNANSQLIALESIDPENTFIAQGRAQIQSLYRGWIENRIRGRDIAKAEEYLKSLSLVPGSDDEVYRLSASIVEMAEQDEARLQSERSAAKQALVDKQTRQRQSEELARDRQRVSAASQVEERELGLSRNWRRGLQIALNNEGYEVGSADGFWGGRTRAGIRLWQKRNGLVDTGYLTKSNYEQIKAELSVIEVSAVQEQQPPSDSSVTSANLETRAIAVSVPETVAVKGGKYKVGSLSDVSLQPFEIGKYEVTVLQFREFLQYSGYRTDAQRDSGGAKGCSLWSVEKNAWQWVGGGKVGFTQTDDHPVTCVSWVDAIAYVEWLNSMTSGGYRLPSEAEWEFATSAGSSGDWSFNGGKSELCKYGNGADTSTKTDFFWSNKTCNDGFERTAPVGNFRGNKFGLHDLHGNVSEWVEDCWHSSLKGMPKDGQAWTSRCDSNKRVMRGGSWYHSAEILNTKHRYWFSDRHRDSATGFRVVRSQTAR